MTIKDTTYDVYKKDGSYSIKVTLSADANNIEKQLAQAKRLREDYPIENGWCVIKSKTVYRSI